MLVSSLGRNLVYGIDLNLVLAIAPPIIPKMAPVTRSQALTIRNLSYIDAAVTLGLQRFH